MTTLAPILRVSSRFFVQFALFTGALGTVIGIQIGSAFAGEPHKIRPYAFICTSPEVYDAALVEAADFNGKSLAPLRKRLRDENKCMYLDDDEIEDLMAPYIQVTEKQGDKARISFTVEYYKKFAELHRRMTRVTFAGWTGLQELSPYYDP